VGAPAAAAAAALLASIAVLVLSRVRDRLPQAAVSARGLHGVPVPRVGGVAIWAGFIPVALALAVPAPMSPMSWGLPWLALFAVSLRDDARGVSVRVRICVHAVAAISFAIALAYDARLSVYATAAVALACVWSLNLYNFMDGSDGLAAAMSIVGFVAYGAVLACHGASGALPLALAAAVVPVLVVNRPPARMFLGDVGAVPLGFLAAALGAGGVAGGMWPLWFPVLVFLPFVADATATLARRLIARERFWESHRSHYYQRLHQLGAGHGGTLASWVALMAGTALTAVACACAAPEWGTVALAAWCVAHAVLFAAIDYHWRRSAPTAKAP
jgi:UDP-N-acetylmuramyl pentapeptide phosphotransferase/UDP-N-acetylglucosamine-1-phosphate transferase